MAALRADLEADEPQRQATALLQALNAVAGGRDVAGAVAYACQGIVRGPAAPTVKRLAYELVRPSLKAMMLLSITAHASSPCLGGPLIWRMLTLLPIPSLIARPHGLKCQFGKKLMSVPACSRWQVAVYPYTNLSLDL